MYDLFILQRNAPFLYNLFDKVMCEFTHFFVSHMSVSSPFATINKYVARSSAKVQNYRGKAPPVKTQGACAPLVPVVPTPLLFF